MPALHVRNVPPEVYEALRARAEREGRSISAQTIAILRRALAQRDSERWVRDLDELRTRFPWPDESPLPEEIIRRDRDSH